MAYLMMPTNCDASNTLSSGRGILPPQGVVYEVTRTMADCLTPDLVGSMPGVLSLANISDRAPVLHGNGSAGGENVTVGCGQGIQSLQLVVRNLHLYFAPVVSPMGVITNLVSMMILRRREFYSLAITHYVISVLSVDTVHLLWILHQWLTIKAVPVYFVGGWCQFVTFTKGVVDFLTVWLIVAMTTERFIALCFPGSEGKLCTVWRSRLVILSLTVIATVVHINISLLNSVLHYHGTPICTSNPQSERVMLQLHRADVFVNGGMAYAVIVVLVACVMVQKIRERRRQHGGRPWRAYQLAGGTPLRQRLSSSSSTRSQQDEACCKQQSEVALAYILLHLAFYLPLRLVRLIETGSLLNKPVVQPSLDAFLLDEVLQHFSHIKLALNLFVLLAFSPTFRRIFLRGLASCGLKGVLLRRQQCPGTLALSPDPSCRVSRKEISTSTELVQYDLWMNPCKSSV